MPTQIEINREIGKLEDFRNRLTVTLSDFGNDHNAALTVQIDILKGDRDMVDVYDEYDPESTDESIIAAAQRAADWLDGDNDDAPSMEWADSPHLFSEE